MGKQGYNGPSGPPGNKGSKGQKGMPGVKGNDGPIGKSGFPSSILGAATQDGCVWKKVEVDISTSPKKVCGPGSLIAGIRSKYTQVQNKFAYKYPEYYTVVECSQNGLKNYGGGTCVGGCTMFVSCGEGTCKCGKNVTKTRWKTKSKNSYKGHYRTYEVKCCNLNVPIEPSNFTQLYKFKELKDMEGTGMVIGRYNNINTCKTRCLQNSSCKGVTEFTPSKNGNKCILHKTSRNEEGDPGFYTKKAGKKGTGKVLGSYSKLSLCKKNCLTNPDCKSITFNNPPVNGFKCNLHDSNASTSGNRHDFYEKVSDAKIKEIKINKPLKYMFYQKVSDEQKMNNIIGKPFFDKQKNWTMDDEISRLPDPRI